MGNGEQAKWRRPQIRIWQKAQRKEEEQSQERIEGRPEEHGEKERARCPQVSAQEHNPTEIHAKEHGEEAYGCGEEREPPPEDSKPWT